MNLRVFRAAAFLIVAAFVLALFLHEAGRFRRRRIAAPSPTPVPTPGEIYVPEKKLDVAKLYNGINVNTIVETEKGLTAEMERDDPSSYTLNLQVRVRVPKPNTDLKELQKLNAHLPEALPWLEAALPKAKVAPFYDDFYRYKVYALNHALPRLDQLISRQHFFDCETALELEDPSTNRHALLIQAAMEVDTDGSDGDRVPVEDDNSPTFQPMTSYRWAKKTDRENPYLAASEERLRKLMKELAAGASAERTRELTESLIPDARSEVTQLKRNSFLVGAVDPFIVLPSTLFSSESRPYAPKVGDYCVVIFDQTLYPAIIGDVGPPYKIGEASLRICKEINALSNANNRPVSELKVTYLVFPDSADKPWEAPDLDKWHARCDELLAGMGGYKGELKAWEDLTKPKPTPTPSPSPSPSPSAQPSASPSPLSSPSASPGAETTSPGSPSASPAPSGSPAPSASPSPSATSPAPSIPPTPKN